MSKYLSLKFLIIWAVNLGYVLFIKHDNGRFKQ